MSTRTRSGEFEQYENISRLLQTFPFILISRTRRLVGMKGLSGALKRTYCYIPAPATATSPGFPVYNNRQLILLNPPSTYLWRTRHFVYRSCWIKWPISVNLCPFNAVGVYKTINLTFFRHKTRQYKANPWRLEWSPLLYWNINSFLLFFKFNNYFI